VPGCTLSDPTGETPGLRDRGLGHLQIAPRTHPGIIAIAALRRGLPGEQREAAVTLDGGA